MCIRDSAGGLTDTQKRDLLATVIDESERLNRFIANLLDMTRLESGAIVPNTALHDIGEIVGSVLHRASKILSHHKVALELAADMPMLQLDAVLFEQALFNLLDNAAKYAPADTTITIRAVRDGEWVSLDLIDEGGGIAPAGLALIVDKVERGCCIRPDDRQLGAGLWAEGGGQPARERGKVAGGRRRLPAGRGRGGSQGRRGAQAGRLAPLELLAGGVLVAI